VTNYKISFIEDTILLSKGFRGYCVTLQVTIYIICILMYG